MRRTRRALRFKSSESTRSTTGMAANLQDFPMLIDGEMTTSRSGQWMTSINPADESELGRTPAAAAEDVNRAVEAGEAAQPAWAELTVLERGNLLRKVAA